MSLVALEILSGVGNGHGCESLFSTRESESLEGAPHTINYCPQRLERQHWFRDGISIWFGARRRRKKC